MARMEDLRGSWDRDPEGRPSVPSPSLWEPSLPDIMRDDMAWAAPDWRREDIALWLDVYLLPPLDDQAPGTPAVNGGGRTMNWFDFDGEPHRAFGPAEEHPEGDWMMHLWWWHGALVDAETGWELTGAWQSDGQYDTDDTVARSVYRLRFHDAARYHDQPQISLAAWQALLWLANPRVRLSHPMRLALGALALELQPVTLEPPPDPDNPWLDAGNFPPPDDFDAHTSW